MEIKYFIDTNIFIYAIEDTGKLGEKARKILRSRYKFSTSVITIEEILTGLYKRKQEDKVTSYLEFISAAKNIEVVTIGKEIAILAARLRAEYNLKSPDALQLASATSIKADYFITADRKIPKRIDNLKVIILN